MSILEVGPKQLVSALKRALPTGVVPYLSGSPGTGKSDIIKNLAKEYNLKLIDVRASQLTPSDLLGLPMREGNKAIFAPYTSFPIEGDEIPEGYNGWLLFFDELSSAAKMVQAAIYRVLLDREVGSHKLHSACAVVGAGNLASDKAVVVQMSTALQSRMVHYEIKVNTKDWIDWGYRNGIDSRILGYIQYKPSALHDFRPDHQDKTFACPRTWSFVSRLIKESKSLDDVDLINIAGAITEGAAVEFKTFCDIESQVPSIEKILSDPEGTDVPVQSSWKYFTISSVVDHTTEKNVAKLLKYISKFPEDFQVIYLRGVTARHGSEFSKIEEFRNIALKILRFNSEEEKDEFGI